MLRALGVTESTRALLCASNTAKCLFTILALTQLGAVAVPCPEELDENDVLQRARAANVNAVATNRNRRPLVERVKDRLPGETSYLLVGEAHEGWARIDTLAESAKPYRDAAPVSAQMAQAYDEARLVCESALAPEPSDRIWATFPMGAEHWFAFVHAAWWRGAATVIHEGAFDPRERLELARELDVTILCQPAHEYRTQLELVDLAYLRMPHLRRCIVLGAPLGAHAEALWQNRMGVPLMYASAVPSPQTS